MKRHPLNAPGPFYVEDGCCLACGVWELVNTDAMGRDEEFRHCFVAHQPDNPVRLQGMIDTMVIQDLGCIRYAGNNRDILERLVKVGQGENCDGLEEIPGPRISHWRIKPTVEGDEHE